MVVLEIGGFGLWCLWSRYWFVPIWVIVVATMVGLLGFVPTWRFAIGNGRFDSY